MSSSGSGSGSFFFSSFLTSFFSSLAGAEAAANKFLAWAISTPVERESPRMFLKALEMTWGAEAFEEMLVAREKAAMFLIPPWSFSFMYSGVILRMAAS